MFIGGFLLFAALTPNILADECASYGPRADRDVPREGDLVPGNAHFRVLLAPECGGVENAPEHEFRVVDGDGTVVTTRRESWARWYVELVPQADLAPGTYEFQVRRPVSQEALGEWTKLVRVTATAERDERAPSFGGIESGTVEAGRGGVPLSPCEVEEGDVLRTRLVFAAADDAPQDHDELLYRLDRRHPGDTEWEEWRTFRPTPEQGKWFFEWTSWEGEAWGVTWKYRIAVRDVAGNETVGEKTVTLTAPTRPGAAAAPEAPEPTVSATAPDASETAAATDGSAPAPQPEAVGAAPSEPEPPSPPPSQPEPRRGCAVAPCAAGTSGLLSLLVVLGVVFRRRRPAGRAGISA